MSRQWNNGKPARAWAAEVVTGTARVDDAPEQYRPLVQTQVDLRVQHWAHKIQGYAALEDRREWLRRCPAGIRDLVEAQARDLWKRRNQPPRDAAKE